MSGRKNGVDSAMRATGKAVSPALAKSVSLHLEGKRKEALRELNNARIAQSEFRYSGGGSDRLLPGLERPEETHEPQAEPIPQPALTP